MLIELLADAVAFWMRFWIYAFVGAAIIFGIIFVFDIMLLFRRFGRRKQKGDSK